MNFLKNILSQIKFYLLLHKKRKEMRENDPYIYK